jgi:hypothetical protein
VCTKSRDRTARSFLESYIRLANMSAESSFAWFVPGFVQPIHALMILLTHLSSCSAIDEENGLSRELIQKTMGLRMKRILNGSIFPLRNMFTQGNRRPDGANPRYRNLWILSRKVWEKNGWLFPRQCPDDSLSERPREPATLNFDATIDADKNVRLDDANGSDLLFHHPENILTGELMDQLSWDEWESLSAGFFST